MNYSSAEGKSFFVNRKDTFPEFILNVLSNAFSLFFESTNPSQVG